MFELFQKGGILMYPIAVCSVVALGIFMDRFWTYSSNRRKSERLCGEVERLVSGGAMAQALQLCRETATMMGRILEVPLRHAGESRTFIKTLVEEVGRRETIALEKFLGLLGTIATITPLLGLLGTVLGMIRAFTVIASEGVGTPATLGGGISEALITTAAGLTVAVPTILLHRYLAGRVEREILDMEAATMHIVDLVGGKD